MNLNTNTQYLRNLCPSGFSEQFSHRRTSCAGPNSVKLTDISSSSISIADRRIGHSLTTTSVKHCDERDKRRAATPRVFPVFNLSGRNSLGPSEIGATLYMYHRNGSSFLSSYTPACMSVVSKITSSISICAVIRRKDGLLYPTLIFARIYRTNLFSASERVCQERLILSHTRKYQAMYSLAFKSAQKKKW